MSRHRLYHYHPKIVRDTLNTAKNISEEILILEEKLIEYLIEIDEKRFFVRYGYKSLMGFCNHGLKFSRTQSQRLVTQVRRARPTVKIEQ
jgi:hypothetical protein